MVPPTKPRWQFFDRMGWPVERIIGRPVTNAIRLLLHTRYVAKLPPNKIIVYESLVNDLMKTNELASRYISRTAPREVFDEIFSNQASTHSAGAAG